MSNEEPKARINSIAKDLETLSRVEARLNSVNTLVGYASQGYEQALKVLLQYAKNDPQEKVRFHILHRLPDYIQENRQLCQSLGRIMESDPKHKVRTEAIACAARLGCVGYVNVTEIVKSPICHVMMSDDLREYLNELDERLQIDEELSEHEGLKRNAVEFMALMGSFQSTVATLVIAANFLSSVFLTLEGFQQVQEATRERSMFLWKLRDRLLNLLSIHPRSADYILELLLDGAYPDPKKDPTVLVTILGYTQKKQDSRFIEPLIELTKSKVASVREGAAMALGHQADSRALKALKSLLKDKAARAASIIARAKISDESLKSEAGKGIKDKNIEVRLAYIQAVGIMQVSEFTDKLLELINNVEDQTVEVAEKAAESLGKIKGCLPILITKFNESFGAIRKLLAIALGATRDSSVVPHLMKGAKSQEHEIKLACIHALGQIDDIVALKELLSLLQSTKDSESRVAIIESIGKIGDESAIDTLFGLFTDQKATSRACVRVLGIIADVDAIDRLQSKWLEVSKSGQYRVQGFGEEVYNSVKEIRIRRRIRQVKGN